MEREEIVRELVNLLEDFEDLNLSLGLQADCILTLLEDKGMLPPETFRGFNKVNRWDL